MRLQMAVIQIRKADMNSSKICRIILETTGTGKIASVSGRYYAMDRDKRWERIKLAYDAMVKGSGGSGNTALEIIQENYEANITDEFIKPSVVLNSDGTTRWLLSPMKMWSSVLISEQTDAGKSQKP